MSEKKTILNRKVNEETWSWFLSELESFAIETAEVAQDGVIDSSDMFQLLDVNRNRRFEFSDLHHLQANFGWEKFSRLKAFLGAYDFDIYRDARDGYRVVRMQVHQDSYFNQIRYDQELDYSIFFRDIDFCRFALMNSAAAFVSIPEEYQRELALERLKADVRLIAYLPVALMNDADFLRELFVRVPFLDGIMNYVMPQVTEIPVENQLEALSVSVLLNHEQMQALGPGFGAIVWAKSVEKMKLLGYDFPETMLMSYSDFRKGLEPLTRQPERFRSIGTLWTLWQNSQNIDSDADTRPIALLTYGVADWNNAFECYPVADQLVASGQFRVIYEEVATDTEALSIVQKVSRKGERPIHTLIFAGHGTPTSLAFGGEDLRVSTYDYYDERTYLDPGDFFMGGKFQNISRYVDPNGQVFLYSCSNGSGFEKAFNLASSLARRLYQSTVVHCATMPANIGTMKIGKDLRLDIEMRSDEEPDVSYRMKGFRGPPKTEKE